MQKIPAYLIRLYESAFVLYLPSKSYIIQPHQYEHPLSKACNLSVSEGAGKMSLASRTELNQKWRGQNKREGESGLMIWVTSKSRIVSQPPAPWRESSNGLHLTPEMPSQKSAE